MKKIVISNVYGRSIEVVGAGSNIRIEGSGDDKTIKSVAIDDKEIPVDSEGAVKFNDGDITVNINPEGRK